jgi:RNA polymerase sigma-70 factor, ECF subfamily
VTEEPDETLSRRAALGDREAFSVLLSRHHARIYRLAWRWCGKRDAAEDIAQDVCVKLASAIRNYRGDSSFATWLHRIAYTTTIDHMRSAQRIVAVEPSEIIRLADSAIDQKPDGNIDGAELWDAVRTLPPQQRDAVLMVYGEDMSHAEAATIMECSEKTVSWHIHAAKKQLRILLEAVG